MKAIWIIGCLFLAPYPTFAQSNELVVEIGVGKDGFAYFAVDLSSGTTRRVALADAVTKEGITRTFRLKYNEKHKRMSEDRDYLTELSPDSHYIAIQDRGINQKEDSLRIVTWKGDMQICQVHLPGRIEHFAWDSGSTRIAVLWSEPSTWKDLLLDFLALLSGHSRTYYTFYLDVYSFAGAKKFRLPILKDAVNTRGTIVWGTL